MKTRILVLLVLAWLGGGAPDDPLLANGDFEARARGDAIAGWTLELGAQNGATKPESKVELDKKEKHGGKASLRFSGDRNTRGWLIAKQEIPVRPGGDYTLEGWTKTAGVAPNGFGLDNCYIGLVFFDAAGSFLTRDFQFPAKPDSGWTKQRSRLTAGPNAHTGYVYVFLSMLGELWVDDLTLAIEGGEPLPEPELVFAESFTKAKRLPSKFKKEVGATNGPGGTEAQVAVDGEVASDGDRSLRLSGDLNTRKWYSINRTEKAEPGELFRFQASVRAEDVHREGIQFDNLHLRLVFLDKKGDTVGPAQYGQPGDGSYDWKPVVVEGVAPEGTKKVLAGIFLSKSGTAWFDELELWKEEGFPPPYSNWETVKVKGIVLRHAADHPEASRMKAYAQSLRASKAATCQALEVEFEEDITVFLYKSNEEGKLLTGGNLDFADPKGRAVHQGWNSYIGHEMVHVIAHNTLQYGRTGILGEGIAVWLNGQPAERHHRRAQELLGAGELPSVERLLSAFREESNGYPAAGSFCGFLLEAHGLELFKQVYPLEDPSAKAKELVGLSFPEMEADWHELLEKYR